MSDTLTASVSQSSLKLASWAIPVVLAAAGVGVQSLAFMNHDVGWVLWSSGRLLDGGTLGRDVVAANPPLIWWISMIPMEAARLTGLSAISCFNLFMLVLLTAGLLASDRLLRSIMPADQRRFLLGAAALLLTVGADRNFGQREHMTAILALPYLLMMTARIRDDDPGYLFAALVGAGAAVGFAFKPHLLAVPLLAELYLVSRIGFRRTLLRPEAVAAVAAVAVYVAAVLIFARPYVIESFPDIARVYWAFNNPDAAVIALKVGDYLFILVLAALFLPGRKWPPLATLFTLAAAGFMVAAALQWKAYTYHLYPVMVFEALAFAAMLARPGAARTIGLVVLTYLAVMTGREMGKQLPGGEIANERAEMIQFVDDNTPAGGAFLAMSTHPFPGFPTALYSHAGWASRANSRLFLPAVVRLRSRNNAEDGELLAFASAKEHEMMLADMTPLPDLVLVDVKPLRHAILDLPFDFVSFYREDPAFAALWVNYEEMPGAPKGYRAFRRWRGAQL